MPERFRGFDADGYRDYRGVNVLGFWRWMRITDWGVMLRSMSTRNLWKALNYGTISCLPLDLVRGGYHHCLLLGKKYQRQFIPLRKRQKKRLLEAVTM